MLVLVETESPPPDLPTGKTTSDLADVLLGVLIQTQAKQFHQLAGKILVRMSLTIRHGIQIDKHRRISRDGVHQRFKFLVGMPAQGEMLLEHQRRIRDFVRAGSKVTMPEQGQLVA